jgi:ribosomal protein S18 acetylase RimI-like enzyme
MTAGGCLECQLLRPRHVESLLRMFQEASSLPDLGYFAPHPFTRSFMEELAERPGKDLYYVLIGGGDCLGYGILRGWNEGFEVPSLGILIGPRARGGGFGRLLMDFLHAAAAFRGATAVRLRVSNTNLPALCLYRSMGYIFPNPPDRNDLLVGTKQLTTRIQ